MTEVREAILLTVVVYLGHDGSQRSDASGSVATPRINISDHMYLNSQHISWVCEANPYPDTRKLYQGSVGLGVPRVYPGAWVCNPEHVLWS